MPGICSAPMLGLGFRVLLVRRKGDPSWNLRASSRLRRRGDRETRIAACCLDRSVLEESGLPFPVSCSGTWSALGS